MARVARFTQGDQNPVGMITHSMLTETQFQALNGTNWILADGRNVSGSRYATLTGNSSAPDLRGRIVVGKDDMGGVAANRITVSGSGIAGTTLGAVGGAETHTLSTNQMPAHRHATNIRSSNNATLIHFFTTNPANRAYASANNTDVTGGFFSDEMQDTGGGLAHNNTQPSMVANVFIKIN